MNTFQLRTNNGVVEYRVDDLDFINIMCDLEEEGVDVMSMMDDDRDGGKVFTFIRGIVSMLLRCDKREAGAKLSEHIRNGGELDDVMEAFSNMMVAAGFGEAEQTATEVPQIAETAPVEVVEASRAAVAEMAQGSAEPTSHIAPLQN